ncbi:hypothetical protein [Halobacillus seohaensis]|uniref:Uncharacterized protein n=1 Tax=Halobacillus seohaensis TaxID=447421 RepID=A0ABW2EHX9_9BACI
MSCYLKQLEPEDVRFLLDFSELKKIVKDMLGDFSNDLRVDIDFEIAQDPYYTSTVRPMIDLQKENVLSHDQQMRLTEIGFSLADEPFQNADHVMFTIFGSTCTIIAATRDEDGDFFTIEMPYHDYAGLIND